MQRGDLSANPLRSLLSELASDSATGCLYVAEPTGGEISVFLDAEHIVGVRFPDASDPLGGRLVARGALSAEVLQTLTTDGSTATSLAERLVAEQLVGDVVVDAVALELAVETIERMLTWTSGGWRFRRRQRPGRPLPAPIPVAELLEDARRRPEAAAADTVVSDAAPDAHTDTDTHEPERTKAWNRMVDDVDVLESLAKASVALNDALGHVRDDDESGRASALIRSNGARSSTESPVDPATAARRDRLRAAAAAELAAAHAEAEQARREYEAGQAHDQAEQSQAQQSQAEQAPAEQSPAEQASAEQGQPEPADHADVVDLGLRREAARAARELAELNRSTVRAPDTEPPVAAPTAVDTPAEPTPAVSAPTPAAPTPAPAAPTPAPAAPATPTPPAPQAWRTGTADHLAATALLREMAEGSAPAAAPPAPGPVEAQPARPAPSPERAPAATGLLRPNAPGGSADTAALLRELSSLGGDDAPARSPSPAPRPSGAGAHAAAANRRRKGLWSRS